MRLYHGSQAIVEKPQHGMGNPRNDYGLGFYCTESKTLAQEWACPEPRDGFANSYELDTGGLRILDLDESPYNTLHWLTLVLTNRRFECTTPLMMQAKTHLLKKYAIDLQNVDVIAGYRADDSYFSFARAFLDNRLSLRQLEQALRFGKLGRQIVLISDRAFSAIRFTGAERVDGLLWHPRRMERDVQARREYQEMVAEAEVLPDDVFVLDLVRKG